MKPEDPRIGGELRNVKQNSYKGKKGELWERKKLAAAVIYLKEKCLREESKL